ncbi:hypothetical protein [Nocardioides pocheonensis]|uniref:F5/8 type C domain-containing protein n=1 Tax=Nocardioides pocheonensis TaxID=661485 RepID=A0A3N0GLI2_9ACTN|nr:hypothetical protein [Nocardioides pocheonensis]RNM13036.1 hypothetical protein EFL26_16535 [Nocardioides pocheonensis]
MRREVPAVVTVLGLAVAGCGFSSVDPHSSVSVSGRALDASGKPLAHAHVVLVRQADIGQVIFGSVLAVGTLSTICFAPDPPAICEKARTATTDADGRYRFELKGSDTQGSLGTKATMNVVFSGRSSQTSTTVSFTTEDTSVTVPDARLWNLGARISAQPGRVRLSWRPLPAPAGKGTGYSVQLSDVRSGAALWTQPASGSRADVDPRLLEDVHGAAAVSAGTDLPGGSGAGKVRASYLSPRLPVPGRAVAPPSRGRPCAPVIGAAGTVGAFGACAETDGDLSRPAGLSGGGTVSGAAVDLGSPRALSLVVVRGFSGQFLVETSRDGTTWQSLATGFGSAYAVEPPGRTTARYLRVRSPTGLDESLSTEISVW